MRTGPSRRSALPAAALLAVLALLVPADAPGQSMTVEEAAERLAAAWGAGDLDAVMELAVDGSIRLDLGVREHPTLSPRQARAALGALMDERGRGPAEIRRARVLGGEPARAFVELSWRPRREGGREVVPHTVFLGLELRDGWRVSEIRVLAASTPDRPPMTTRPWR